MVSQKDPKRTEGTAVETTETVAGELVKRTDFDYGKMKSFEDALAQAAEMGGYAVSGVDVLGDGFAMLKEKDKLVGVDLAIVGHTGGQSTKYRDQDGNGRTFSVVRVITKEGKRYILTDGSTGIHKQLRQMEEMMGEGWINNGHPIVIRGGLVRSGYTYTDNNGNQSEAETFYFASANEDN